MQVDRGKYLTTKDKLPQKVRVTWHTFKIWDPSYLWDRCRQTFKIWYHRLYISGTNQQKWIAQREINKNSKNDCKNLAV